MVRPSQYVSLALLKVYKTVISPVLSAFGVTCRHTPSCSDYSRIAISRHGFWAGGWMTLARLLRCQPFGTHGIDDVPDIPPRAHAFLPWRYGRWRGTYEAPHSPDLE